MSCNMVPATLHPINPEHHNRHSPQRCRQLQHVQQTDADSSPAWPATTERNKLGSEVLFQHNTFKLSLFGTENIADKSFLPEFANGKIKLIKRLVKEIPFKDIATV